MNRENTNKPEGIFDSVPKRREDNNPNTKKEEFKDPFKENQEQIASRVEKAKPSLDDLIKDNTLEKTANAVNNAGPGKNVQADLDDMERFSEEDIRLAEQMIFRGYAEFDAKMPRFENHKFTICSTSAEEISIVDEIVFDHVKRAENDDGIVNLPQNNVQGLKNSLFIAISYRGMDQKELIEDSSCHLNTIKRAIIKVSDLESAGDIDGSSKLKESLKKKLLQRSVRVRRLATPMIDFLSDKKYEFDTKMLSIMNSPGILPKS